jgi:hypothetical protein
VHDLPDLGLALPGAPGYLLLADPIPVQQAVHRADVPLGELVPLGTRVVDADTTWALPQYRNEPTNRKPTVSAGLATLIR